MDSQQEQQSHPIEGLMKTAMQAIKEMVAGLGGMLNISSRPGKGVKVMVMIPTGHGTSVEREPQ